MLVFTGVRICFEADREHVRCASLTGTALTRFATIVDCNTFISLFVDTAKEIHILLSF